MKGQRRRCLFVLLVLVITLVPSRHTSHSTALASAGRDLSGQPPAGVQTTQSGTKLAGAYFFYWWLFPNDPDGIDPYNQIAFHPPGLLPHGADPPCFHGTPWCIGYQVGEYNTAYYDVSDQRWWEWQFQDMVEAGLDVAFFNSWDGESLAGQPYFLTPGKRINAVAAQASSALDTLGNPLKIGLFDDTASEQHQWCVDVFDPSLEMECIEHPDWEQYKMPLDGTVGGHSTREYFWRKVQVFFDAIPQDKWATHNGLPVEQGGRPLLLMWHPDFFRNLRVGEHSFALDLMCGIKADFFDRYGVEPFLLPNWLWSYRDPDVNFETFCPAPSVSFQAIDGFSAYGAADGTFGAVVYPNHSNSYTTAYLGPGRDDSGYSGPFGTVESITVTVPYHARWWDTGHDEIKTENQDHYYGISWEKVIADDVDLVVVESWNELKEGSSICRLESYVAPDLRWCNENDFAGRYSQCPQPAVFDHDPIEQTGTAWTPHYWIRVTADRVSEWKGGPAPASLVVDNNNDAGLCPDGGDFIVDQGEWSLTGSDYRYCEDARHTFRNTLGQVRWLPWLADNPGVYDVYAWWQKDAGATQDAHFLIHGETDSVVRIDQSRSRDAGRWNYLGTFPLAEGSSVGLTGEVNHPVGSVVLADAIRLVYRGPYTPPTSPTPTPPVLTPQGFLPVVVGHAVSQRALNPPTPAGGSQGYPAPPSQTPLPTATSIPPPPPDSSGGGYPPPPSETPVASPTPQPGDATPPRSAVDPLPPFHNQAVGFSVTWSGTDGAGSGISLYDVQSRDGEGPWVDWLVRTSAPGGWFNRIQAGHTYSFRCRAHDRAGNAEAWPADPDCDTSTTVDLRPPKSKVAGLPPYNGGSFTVSWAGWDRTSGIDTYELQYCVDDCADPGTGWTAWHIDPTQTSAVFSGAQDGHAYFFRCRARDQAGNVEPWPAEPDTSTRADTIPPSSHVHGLPAFSTAAFTVTWSGQDAGSGVSSFDVQFCQNDCAETEARWTGWLTGTNATAATFTGAQDGQGYHFRSRAHDAVGNAEDWPSTPDAYTTVDRAPPSSRVVPLPTYSPLTFTVTWEGEDEGSGVSGYDVQVCASSQPTPDCWQDWLTHTLTTAAPFSGTHDQTYAFRCRARDLLGNEEPLPAAPAATTRVDAQGPHTRMRPPVVLEAGDLPQNNTFLMQWEGKDELSGIAGYSLYVRDEADEAWLTWLEGVTATEALFVGTAGHSYHFCVRGIDRVGNVEDKACPGETGGWPIAGEAVAQAPPVSRVEGLPPFIASRRFEVRWGGSPGVVTYDVQVYETPPNRTGGRWRTWLRQTEATAAWFTGRPGYTYAFRCRVVDPLSGAPLEPWPWSYDTRTTVRAVIRKLTGSGSAHPDGLLSQRADPPSSARVTHQKGRAEAR